MLVRTVSAAAFGIVLAAAGATASVAAEKNDEVAPIELAVAIEAPGASVALMFDRTNVLRQKNITKAVKIDTGIYCFQVAKRINGKRFDTKKAVVNVSVDWSNSNTDDLLAYWRSEGAECPSTTRWFEIVTFDFPSGVPAPSDDVAFVATIP